MYQRKRACGAIVAHRAAEQPDRVFIRFEEAALTYGHIDTALNRFANHPTDLVITASGKAAITLENRPESIGTSLDTAEAGVVELRACVTGDTWHREDHDYRIMR